MIPERSLHQSVAFLQGRSLLFPFYPLVLVVVIAFDEALEGSGFAEVPDASVSLYQCLRTQSVTLFPPRIFCPHAVAQFGARDDQRVSATAQLDSCKPEVT